MKTKETMIAYSISIVTGLTAGFGIAFLVDGESLLWIIPIIVYIGWLVAITLRAWRKI